MTADRSIKFNKIYLLHSLQDDDYNLTSALTSRVLPELQAAASHIQYAAFETNSLDQMNAALEIIEDETRSGGTLPLIQFDMHGASEYFITKSWECIMFEDISPKLESINRLSRFNLLLFIVSCEGATFISQIVPSKPSPCWGIVSSTKQFVSADASNFIEVYKKAISEERGWHFVDVLNDEVSGGTTFSVFSAEEIFKTTFKMYIKEYTGEEQLSQRACSMQETLGRGYFDVAEFSLHKDMLLDVESSFNKCKRTFFMIDEFPENAERFPLIVHDIYNPPIIGVPSKSKLG